MSDEKLPNKLQPFWIRLQQYWNVKKGLLATLLLGIVALLSDSTNLYTTWVKPLFEKSVAAPVPRVPPDRPPDTKPVAPTTSAERWNLKENASREYSTQRPGAPDTASDGKKPNGSSQTEEHSSNSRSQALEVRRELSKPNLQSSNPNEISEMSSSKKEIDPAVKHQKREETAATPNDLRRICKDADYNECKYAVQPYIGKWVRFAEIIQKINGHQKDGGFQLSTIPSRDSFDMTILQFSDEYREFFIGLKVRQKLSTFCRIKSADLGFVMMEDCEQPSIEQETVPDASQR